ncbi:hypothetical protein IH981_02280 [Patescibacteria group bacterium]|nr:hypothetical protein [Patescibacteria group bacterium]
MKNKTAQIFIASSLTATLLFNLSTVVFGQELRSGQIASNTEVDDPAAKAGDILTRSGDQLVRAAAAYDPNLFGVVVENPSVVLNKTSESTLPIVSYGEVLVRVSSENGQIQQGEFITSSKKPG